MSVHYRKQNYECSKCQAFFLPYKIGIKCPNCDASIDEIDTREYIDVIKSIVDSMELHKLQHGRYFPGAWYTGDFMDHVQGMMYQIFDAMEKVKPDDEEKYLMDLLENKFDWGNQLYSKKHLKDIASEIYKIYKDKNFDEIKSREFIKPIPQRKPLTKWEKIKKWFDKFLP